MFLLKFIRSSSHSILMVSAIPLSAQRCNSNCLEAGWLRTDKTDSGGNIDNISLCKVDKYRDMDINTCFTLMDQSWLNYSKVSSFRQCRQLSQILHKFLLEVSAKIWRIRPVFCISSKGTSGIPQAARWYFLVHCWIRHFHFV